MNKELEAYRRLCSHLDYDTTDYMFNGNYEEDDKVIENALKNYPTLKREYDFGVEHYNELLNVYNKEHKALEIIKEKRVDVNWLLQCFTHTKRLESYNQDRKHKITQEEYDLLKEVLL